MTTEIEIEHVYVVVCKDIPVRHQAVQACHAAIAAAQEIIHWKQPYLVVLTVRNQHELIDLSTRLSGVGIQHRVFHKDDMDGRPTALATQNIKHDQREFFKGMQLYTVKTFRHRPWRRRGPRRRG